MKIVYLCLLIASFSILSKGIQGDCQVNYVVKKGDTLSDISFDFLGSPVWGNGNSLDRVAGCNPQIKDIHLIFPGNHLSIPKVTNTKNHLKPRENIIDDSIGDEVINEEIVNNDESQESKKRNKRTHSFYAEINSFHSELAGVQTTGSAIGSEADEILSDPSISGQFVYSFGLSEKIALKAILDFKNYIYSEDIGNQVLRDQRRLTINPGLGILYKPFSFFYLNFNVLSFEQGFYGVDSSSNFIFDYERLLRLEINPEFKILEKNSFDLGIGLLGSYYLDGDEISNASGFGVEPFVKAFFDKNLRFHVRYQVIEYDFISSEIKNELLEIGLRYEWNF